MKKYILASMLILTLLCMTMSALAASIDCGSWKDTGKYSDKICVDEWCGLNPFLNVMKGTREQRRVCNGYDDSGNYVEYAQVQNVDDWGSCC